MAKTGATEKERQEQVANIEKIYTSYPQWRRLMDKELVAQAQAGHHRIDEVVTYIGARRFRKYMTRNGEVEVVETEEL
jgi:hypothetical protein